jgi:deoxyribose-phosphate aldolase
MAMAVSSVMTDQAVARLALSCLDLTDLGESCSAADVDALCERAQGLAAGLPPVAAVCVWPQWAAQARQRLPEGIAVAAVVNFPGGDQPLESVLRQIGQIRDAGAQEVDAVLPYRRLTEGPAGVAACHALLRDVRRASQGLRLKVILESGELPDGATLAQACAIALAEGADFLKTSTGKTPRGASLSAAAVMLDAIAADPRSAQLGFKPSGGLRTLADVRPYLELVARTLGPQALQPGRFRIGASGLWNDIARSLSPVAGAPAHPAAAGPSPSAY